jgi:DNA-binding CsgD family transcriptional regulator
MPVQMNETLQIIITTGSLITGLIVIMFSNQLVRKYRLPWLSSYFYYLIFLFVFGIYGVIGSRLIRVYLENMGLDQTAIEDMVSFFTFLGIPFIVLSWYMFIRLCRELVNQKISSLFNLIFFVPLALGFLGYGVLLIKRELLGESNPGLIRSSMLAGFTVVSLLVYAYSLTQLFLHSRRFLDNKDRQHIRLFGLLYLVYAAGTLSLLNLSQLDPIYGFGFIIWLFALHLVPIFFLSLYLDKNFVDPAVQIDFDRSLADFIQAYQISRRESEIVQLICKGKSNQDISDSLFISLQTVKDHIHRIYLKTGVKNRVQLTNLIRTFS